jgi:thioredoxin-like negative regulator of GroEL
MDLNNPARQRRIDEIIASLPDLDRAKAIRSLATLDRAVEQQQRFDAAVAAALDRILMNAPAEALRPLAKQLRKRIKEIANDL